MLESTTGGATAAASSALTLDKFGAESARIGRELADQYHRYHIETEEVDDVDPLPHRFLVEVGKIGLAKFILSEVFHYGMKPDVLLSRPCTYGVFSGPVGGFSPLPKLCVGCLRCTVQHPDFVKVLPNPKRLELGDSYTTHGHIAAIDEESKRGMVPVRGQGYRGRFGGPGFDGMLTDMSEIVRPSRDGIHGRELIGTSVDIGTKPMHLSFDEEGNLQGKTPNMFTIQVPFIFDVPPGDLGTAKLAKVLDSTSQRIDTLACLKAADIVKWQMDAPNIVPIIPTQAPEMAELFPKARLVQLDGWDKDAFDTLRESTDALIGVRIEFSEGWQERLMKAVNNRVDLVHLNADLHGRGYDDNRFISDLLKEAHLLLIEKGCRDMVTLVGAGGIVSADHLPKAIISGLDAVALDLPVLFALQGRSHGSLTERDAVKGTLPRKMTQEWAEQRLTNLCASWRDQLLEILGAMGIREVRRLRGEFGRSMIVSHLEDEAFEGIEGYVSGGVA